MCFDWYEPEKYGYHQKPMDYTYGLIETLLPKAIEEDQIKDGKIKEFRLVELWGDATPRKGWHKFVIPDGSKNESGTVSSK